VVVIAAALVLNALVSPSKTACGDIDREPGASDIRPLALSAEGSRPMNVSGAWSSSPVAAGVGTRLHYRRYDRGRAALLYRDRAVHAGAARSGNPWRDPLALEVVAAYALAIVGGFAIGFARPTHSFSRQSLYPIILLLYAIPQAVLLPLFTLGFDRTGGQDRLRVQPRRISADRQCVAGMRNVSPHYLRAADGREPRRYSPPSHLPHMWELLHRLSGHDLTLLGVILAELYVSTSGVGYFLLLPRPSILAAVRVDRNACAHGHWIERACA
jgi:hypothetical protein